MRRRSLPTCSTCANVTAIVVTVALLNAARTRPASVPSPEWTADVTPTVAAWIALADLAGSLWPGGRVARWLERRARMAA